MIPADPTDWPVRLSLSLVLGVMALVWMAHALVT